MFVIPLLATPLLAPAIMLGATGTLMSAETPKTPGQATATSTPFFSQFNDIENKWWGKRSCGIASLAMVIDAHTPGLLATPEPLLKEGIALNGYTESGWLHSTLITLGEKYGLRGEAVDLAHATKIEAVASLKSALESGPALASVHYKLEPHNPIPHLIVVHNISTSSVTLSDPANARGDEVVPLATFEAAWKKRYIAFRKESEKRDKVQLATK